MIALASAMRLARKSGLTRRDLLSASVLAGGAWLIGMERLALPGLAFATPQNPFANGTMLGLIPFADENHAGITMETLVKSELDGRLYTDLAALREGQATVPTEKFYVRTSTSHLLDVSKPWTIQLGPADKRSTLSLDELRSAAEPQGIHLMECSGNVRDTHFGLLSAAEWTGVPLAHFEARIAPKGPSSRVLVSGFDAYEQTSTSSQPGASWIFTWEQLTSAGAFLVTTMNGQPLASDHGAPVRIVVPGWYGCVSIKWLNEISPADEDAESTSQMQEFAQRTHQQGVPKFAREFESAVIDPAAVPIRIEKWRVGEKIAYRIVGIEWGGPRRAKSLDIEFSAPEKFAYIVRPGPEAMRQTVSDIVPTQGDSWAFWTCAWTPPRSGTYVITLRITDPSVRTRRLDMNYYARIVKIDEV